MSQAFMFICARETSVFQINLNNVVHFYDHCLLQNATVYLSVRQPWLYVRTHRPILIVAMETECCQRSPHSKRPSLSLCFHSPPPAASVFRSAPLHFYVSCLSVRSFFLGSSAFRERLHFLHIFMDHISADVSLCLMQRSVNHSNSTGS